MLLLGDAPGCSTFVADGLNRQLIDDAVDAILVNDETRRRYLSLADTVDQLFRAILPDVAANEFSPARKLFAVLAHKMPPWFADPHWGSFSNDARLSESEIETVKAWVDGGAAEGEARDLPAAPVFIEGWRLGKPDIVIDIGQDFEIKPGKDAYEHFTVPTNFTEGRWIRAAEIRPGNRRVVHHVHVSVVGDARQAGSTSIESMTALSEFLLRDGTLTRVRSDAPVVDNACAADAPDLPYLRGFQEGALASFLPGRSPDMFPDGSAKWIPPGSKLEFVVHYARTSKASQTDRTSVGLYLAPAPPARVLRRMDLRNFFFRIPPGDAHHDNPILILFFPSESVIAKLRV